MIQQQYLKPSFIEAFFILLVTILTITYSLSYLQWTPHQAILLVLLFLILYGFVKGVSIINYVSSIGNALQTAIGAVVIFLLIGILISSWMISGTIPTLLFYGLSILSASFFYATTFLLTSIVGTVLGSSLTTVATVGVAFITIAGAFDFSVAITAGAIVSGAFFGDKMSPLSDTTNLAASIVKIDLFVHIKNMLWTTVPAFIISCIVFAILSPNTASIDSSIITSLREALQDTQLVHIYALLPVLILIGCTLWKIPAFITLAISAISGIVLSYLHMPLAFTELLSILYNGYVSETGVETVDSFLTRGGIQSMYFTIGLVILALIMGSLLFGLGIIQALLEKLESMLRSVGHVITGTAFTAIGINLVIGEQYLSLLLTGEAFKAKFTEMKLHPKNLARVMEDAGTVINPLVPWSVCGIFISTVLQVPVIEYLPFALFCLLSPILTIVFGWLGITLTKLH